MSLRLQLPHIPRFISASLVPALGTIVLWGALVAGIGTNILASHTRTRAFWGDVVAILQDFQPAAVHQELSTKLWASGLRAQAYREATLAREDNGVLGASTLPSDDSEEGARDYWARISRAYPDYAGSLVQLAVLSYSRGDVRDARDKLLQAQGLDPNNAVVAQLLNFTASVGP